MSERRTARGTGTRRCSYLAVSLPVVSAPRHTFPHPCGAYFRLVPSYFCQTYMTLLSKGKRKGSLNFSSSSSPLFYSRHSSSMHLVAGCFLSPSRFVAVPGTDVVCSRWWQCLVVRSATAVLYRSSRRLSLSEAVRQCRLNFFLHHTTLFLEGVKQLAVVAL